MDSQELAYELARIIDNKLGTDIVVIDLRGIADIAEFFVIATGANNRQVDAIVDEIENVLRPKGVRPITIEGREDNTWDLMDFGAVICHVFQPEARSFYRLEKLWGDAPRAEFVDGQIVEAEPAPGNAGSEVSDADAYEAAVEAADLHVR